MTNDTPDDAMNQDKRQVGIVRSAEYDEATGEIIYEYESVDGGTHTARMGSLGPHVTLSEKAAQQLADQLVGTEVTMDVDEA